MFPEIHPLRTEIIRLDEGDLFALTVNVEGDPVWWPNLYCSVKLRPDGIALSTMQAQMRAVCQFHNWCAVRKIPLRQRIESLDLLTMEETDALRIELRRSNRNSKVVCNAHWRARLWAVSDYITWQTDHVISRLSVRDERLAEGRKRLAELPKRLIGDVRTHRNTSKEGMDKNAEIAFLNAILPGHPTNPFSERNHRRNHGLWRLYHAGGIRLSEAILLKCNDMHLNGPEPWIHVERRPDDLDDPRKQEPRTKTLSYPVMLTPDAAMVLSDYMIFDRPTYPDAKKSPYVFLSQKGKPLSISAVVDMYRQLRENVDGLPDHFTTHVLRRTWNDRFGDAAEELGLGQETEKQVRNRHQGWSPSSDQSFAYQRRRLRRKGNAIAVKMQEMTEARKNDG